MQLELDIPPELPSSAYDYGTRSDGETHGLVLTKPHVVRLILDLAGYTSDRDLPRMKLLEPSCGRGAFLVPAVERLLDAAHRTNALPVDLVDAVRAFDIEPRHVAATRGALFALLCTRGIQAVDAHRLVATWVQHGDFLLAKIPRGFDFVVGNPPYVRIEQLAKELQAAYRSRYRTLYDRADLYVAFIERCLDLLAPGGSLSFICADRWILNRYGAPLRTHITSNFSVNTYIDLHKASPFESDVIAYPSIFVISRHPQTPVVHVAHMSDATPEECGALQRRLSDPVALNGPLVERYDTWFVGDAPWVLSAPECRKALRELESRHPLIEDDDATFVRIGVATGNDSVLIVPEDADIERDRLLPLVMRDDIANGQIKNAHRCVINTYSDGAGVVDLAAFPRLRAYVRAHRERLAKRHVAQKAGDGWFKTIDRVYPHMVSKPKLLIPDIAGSNEVVFDEGRFYPHHNLYFILSDSWDLEVLGGLISSRVALFFVWSYAVKMRGGYLRFQAQYLRRIRVPRPSTLSASLQQELRKAFRARDFKRIDELALGAYGISSLPSFDFVDTRR